MTFDEYQALASRTTRWDHEPVDGWPDRLTGPIHMLQETRLLHGACGIASESGEIMEHVKHWKFHDHSLDREHLIKELGDLLWYIAEAASAIDATVEEIAARNIEKLKKRYPNGFEVERSKHRDTEKE